ncbi:FAD-dependent oxidoreductase [Paraburkholderia silviterrae]|uniref:Pyridine nucleotide-disulfide oxidoreductase n=1 Tax=Paraburkholderia silviterrae TaxID=2528715 RepID=A0A4R5M845_9BURK|nr:FAD-dependent oxidoreductase [Paraburkholderia silviterrae]TDG22052.1 pyridine nucleotide-disulfide oxidoreductase [Paraburkholderia silviterrae]
MSKDSSAASERDFTQGVPLDDIADEGILTGQVGDESVLLVRKGGEFFAVAATCTHYGGPLAEGLVVGDTIRCPWHHAAFCLRDGQVAHAPALDGLKCWRVEQSGGRAFVREALPAQVPPKLSTAKVPESVMIIGGGAAGNAAAMTLRSEGYAGPITVWSADAAPPYDRPNLSKDYLAGTADPAWLQLRSPEFYAEERIEVRCDQRVVQIDPANKAIALANGAHEHYGALLIATGAIPIRLAVPGAQLPHVRVLRSLADCDALIARLATTRRCVVVGAGFIGLEAAAALRTRGVEVHVVMRGAHPLERVLGAALGDMLKKLHESHGVVFHVDADVNEITANSVKLSTGDELPAELVVTGIGVAPEVALAQQAGLAIDRGVSVNEYLQTSAAGVYAAGDIARWPDPRTGGRIRVEHWVVAERQGVVAARNMLGMQQRFEAVPFFWTQHYDLAINYVGHAEGWDRVDIDGDPAAHACAATYWRGNQRLAVATVGRDLESLRAEAALEVQTPVQ